jgi:hypothetical protein
VLVVPHEVVEARRECVDVIVCFMKGSLKLTNVLMLVPRSKVTLAQIVLILLPMLSFPWRVASLSRCTPCQNLDMVQFFLAYDPPASSLQSKSLIYKESLTSRRNAILAAHRFKRTGLLLVLVCQKYASDWYMRNDSVAESRGGQRTRLVCGPRLYSSP